MMRKWIACYLVLAMVVIGVVSPAQASFISSESPDAGNQRQGGRSANGPGGARV